ncbi:MAG: carbonic anhydrase [Acidobacteriaceae bacterium]
MPYSYPLEPVANQAAVAFLYLFAARIRGQSCQIQHRPIQSCPSQRPFSTRAGIFSAESAAFAGVVAGGIAAVLACADSRVPVEIVFDQTIGHLFVTRVAGNIITPEILGSLEYGVAVLGTKVILVLGHSNSVAVKAAVAGKAVPGQISSLYAHLQPAVDETDPDYKAVAKANAKIRAKLLSQASTVVSEKIKKGQLKVVAGYYDIGSGIVTLLS